MTVCHFNRFDTEDAPINAACNDAMISNCSFRICAGDALAVDYSNIDIQNSRFDSIQGDAVDCSGTQIDAKDLEIWSIVDKRISLGENSEANLQRISISFATNGISIKNGANTSVSDIKVQACDYGGVCFSKKKYWFLVIFSGLANLDKIKNLMDFE
jgi:hypothetical protein